MANYWSNFRCQVRPTRTAAGCEIWPQEIRNVLLSHNVKHINRHFEPFKRDSRVWQTDERQTHRRTDQFYL